MKDRNSLASLGKVEDRLLAGIAARIQLSATNYDLAVSRYQAINDYLDRDDGILAGRIQIFYPQGSMAVGSTIASRLTTDNFDLDIIAQLILPLDTDPKDALDLLYKAIKGEPGSRYYDMVDRKSRCVTVNYADGMHVDITPMVRRPATLEREGVLFHFNHEKPWLPRHRPIANPYGFAEWFCAMTPRDALFAANFAELAKSIRFLDAATQDPIPERQDFYLKAKAVIVLQLLKRFRNIRYDRRAVRRPPSVLMSKLVADNAGTTSSLSDELLHQAKQMYSAIKASALTSRLIHVVNPVCPQDVFTDRWPESQKDQSIFLDDLEHLIEQVTVLKHDCPLEKMQEILVDLFGENPTLESVRELAQSLGRMVTSGNNRYVPSSAGATGSAALVGLSSAATSTAAKATPAHRFYGD